MDCEFCEASLDGAEPENVTLLRHVETSAGCRAQYTFMLENLRASWTLQMSGA